MEKAGREMLEESARSGWMIPTTIVVERNARQVMMIVMPSNMQMMTFISGIVLAGMNADCVRMTYDTYDPLIEINPLTGEPWNEGNMGTAADEDAAVERGWIIDALGLGHVCHRAGAESIMEFRSLRYRIEGRKFVVTDVVDSLPRQDIGEALQYALDTDQVSATEMFPRMTTDQAELSRDLMIAAKIQMQFPVQCVMPQDEKMMTTMLSLTPMVN